MTKNIIIIVLFFIVESNLYTQPLKLSPYFNAVIVSDVDSSAEWYSDIFGLSVRNKSENSDRGYKIINLEGENLLIELLQLNSSVTRKNAVDKFPNKLWIQGFMKVGFKVEDIEELYKSLSNKSVKFRGGMVTDKLSNKKTFLIEDPDGNIIQFFEK